MHFVMHVFNNHVEVLHNVTPFVLLQQMAVLSDRVVVEVLHQLIPLLWRGGGRSPTGWLWWFCTNNSLPVEGWRAYAFCNACV